MSPETAKGTKFYRSSRHKVIGGVCSGIALHKNCSVALVRLIALMTLSTGIGVLAYIALWLLMPPASQNPSPEPIVLPFDPLVRSKNDRVMGGVCGGLAKFLDWDPLIIRVVFVVLLFSYGISLIPYVYAWVSIPQEA